MTITTTPLLKIGDTIGFVAPSRATKEYLSRIKEAEAILNKFGFNIKYGKNFTKEHRDSAGTLEQRAKDLNEMFTDKSVKAIFCAVGGDTTNQILDLIDYNLVAQNPKIFMGYSDITHLLLAIYKKSNLITYHGPNLNNFSKINKGSLNETIKTLTGRRKKIDFSGEFETYKEGKALGKLIGGNLLVINSLSKTEFCPDFTNAILFFEDIDEGIASLEYQLYQLKLSGFIKTISGIVIGHIEQKDKNSESIREIILETTEDQNYPIIKMDNFGHNVKNFVCFPVGAKAHIDTYKGSFRAGV